MQVLFKANVGNQRPTLAGPLAWPSTLNRSPTPNATIICGRCAMPNDAVVANLKSLKLFGMAGAVAELAEQGAPAYHQSTGLLDHLIKAEVADREVRSIN